MSPFRRGTTLILCLTGITLVIIAFGIEYFNYHRNQQFLLADLQNRLIEHTANVNLRGRTVQGYVNGLKVAAENLLTEIQRFGVESPFYSSLKNNPEGNRYFLDVDVSSFQKLPFGNLKGKGRLDGLSQGVRDELNMALSLNIFFENALKNNRGAVWVYYTSQNHFQNVYPWVPVSGGFSEDLRDEALQNDRYRNYWTPIRDLKHHGLVVTSSSPVYDGSKFLGTVSLDLSLRELDRVMNRIQSLEGALYLINKNIQVLATKGVSEGEKGIKSLDHFLPQAIIHKIKSEIDTPSHAFLVEGSSLIYVADLHETPWYMVYIGSKSSLFMTIFYESLEDLFLISILLIFVVGTGYILVIRNFITPAEKLVNHISNENKGLKSSPHNIPTRWQPWFAIISRIFAENRAHLSDLETRVLQRTQQLEKSLKDLKKAQNQIIVQEKLVSLGALTAGIAHEIKNPLNFVINFSELSLENLHALKEKVSKETELFDLAEQNMTKTIEHAQRADAIVKSMLTHARGSSGEITTFNLNSVVNESTELGYSGFLGWEGQFSVKIIKNFDTTIGEIEASKQDLARVILNIINNACFAMHEKKQKVGKAYHPLLNIETKSDGNRVRITIEDNGPGMSKPVLKKVFTPFFTTKDPGKGTGLGLSLSYDIITHQHQGHLSVESGVGKFTRFIIELPKNSGGFHE